MAQADEWEIARFVFSNRKGELNMSRFETLFAIMCLCAMATTARAAKPAGLTAEWNFDERMTIDGKGDVARDSSGNGHDAKLHGPVWVKHGKGFVIGLDGFDDYVDCGKSTDLGLGGPATLELWLKSTRKAHGESKLLGEQYSTYVLTYYNGERVYWYISSGGNNIRAKLSLNQWYHVVATFDGKYMRLFVNGRQVQSKESNIKTYTPAGNFHIGTKGSPQSPKFKGMVDRVRVYNRAISGEEAMAHFLSERSEYIDLTWSGRVKITPYYYTDRREVVVDADYKHLQPLKGKGRLDVMLSSKKKPNVFIKQKKIDGVPTRAGLAEVTLPCSDLPDGDYIVKAILTDGHGAFPTEEFTFSYPLKSRPLAAPAQKVAPPLPPKRKPAPFKFKMGKGGGFTIKLKNGSYPFQSRISWPNGDFNRLSPGDKRFTKGEKSWRCRVRTTGKNKYQVRAGGGFYMVQRDVEVFPTHVYIKDKYTNPTNKDLGLLIYNETLVKPGQVAESLISGYDRRGRQQEGSLDSCPSAFFTDANTGMGIVPVDDVYVVQAVPYVDWQGAAGVGTEKFALAPGASYTLEWAVYPTVSGDYYDFVNAFRTVENRIGTVDGAPGYVTYSPRSRRMVVDKEFIEMRGLKIGIFPCLAEPVDDPNLPIEGIEFIDFPKERELLRLQTTALHKKHPGVKLVFHIAHSLFATNNPDRFADSKVINADGTQARWGDGRYFGKKHDAEGYRYYGFYPYYDPETGATNSFHDAMMHSVDVMMDEMGFDGGQMDGFLAGYTGRWSYDTDLRWDGHSADIDGRTKTITRKVNSVILISLPSMIEYARKIRDKGGVTLAMHTVFMRSIANEKYIVFTDEGTGPQLHLAPSMMPLSFPQLTSEKGLYLDMLDKLSWGELYAIYSEPTFFSPGLTHYTLSSKEFPMTFEEIRSGLVKGPERIVTMNSGVYGWHGDRRLHLIYKFDGRGAPVPNDFITTVDKNGVRTELKFLKNESAVIEPIPVTLNTSVPVNVRVLQYDDTVFKALLNGKGEAALEIFVGSPWPDWRNPPGYRVAVAGAKTTIKAAEKTGLLSVPLKLNGLVEVVIDLAGGGKGE